ncbi:protein YfeA [Salmonella enterica subsp. enterica]|nr:protein YfeA [Salmonella enterica subsp. enterica]
MARINQRSEWLNRQWHSQALTDPLTQLPNLRALEQFLLQDAGQSVCYLRMENLEFLSRHYGMQMRVHCEREVFRVLQPLLLEKEKIFHLPGSELLLVLTGRRRKPACNICSMCLITAKFTGTIPVWTWNTAHRGEHSMVARKPCNRCWAIKLAGGAILLASSGACTDPEY